MKPIIEFRSQMRVRPWAKYRLGLLVCLLPWLLGFGVGYWIGSPVLVSSELNRQEAQDVATEIFRECDRLFIPESKPERVIVAANNKCERLFNIALDSGYRAREKKK